ncbi:MAG: hypothetical protein AABY22_20130 [Nanoarchaeota archaeon]
MNDNYLDRLITEKLIEQQEDRGPSGKLSASKLWWPLQWQILATQFGLKSHIDEYTMRKFQRGHDVEDWFIKQIQPKEKQKFLEYRGAIGYCDAIVDTEKWDTNVGIIPLEVKSITNLAFKWFDKESAKKGHIIQNAFYAIAYGSEYHAITYIASDDYRILTTIHKTKDVKDEIEKIIDEFEEAVKSKTIPLFMPREDWQKSLKYNNFPQFAGMNKEELAVEYKKLISNK